MHDPARLSTRTARLGGAAILALILTLFPLPSETQEVEGTWITLGSAPPDQSTVVITREGDRYVGRWLHVSGLDRERGYRPGAEVLRVELRDGRLVGEYFWRDFFSDRDELVLDDPSPRPGCADRWTAWLGYEATFGERRGLGTTIDGDIVDAALADWCGNDPRSLAGGARSLRRLGPPLPVPDPPETGERVARRGPPTLTPPENTPAGETFEVPSLQADCACEFAGHGWEAWEGIRATFQLRPDSLERHLITSPGMALKATGSDRDLLWLEAVERIGSEREACRSVRRLPNAEPVTVAWKLMGPGTFSNGHTTATGDGVIYRLPTDLLPGESRSVVIEVSADDGPIEHKADDEANVARLHLELERPERPGQRKYVTIETTKFEDFRKIAPATVPPAEEDGCGCRVESVEWLAGTPLTVALEGSDAACPVGLGLHGALARDRDDLEVSVSSARCGGDRARVTDVPDVVTYRDWSVPYGVPLGGTNGQSVLARAPDVPATRSHTVRLGEADDLTGNQYDDAAEEAEARIDVARPKKIALVADGGDYGSGYEATLVTAPSWFGIPVAPGISGKIDTLDLSEFGMRQADAMGQYLETNGFEVTRLSAAGIRPESSETITYAGREKKQGLFLDLVEKLGREFGSADDLGEACCHEFFLYFGGHGNADGIGFYPGKDEYSIEDDVDYVDLLDRLDAFPENVKVTLFLDACGSGGIFTGLNPVTTTRYSKASLYDRVRTLCKGHCGVTILTSSQGSCYAISNPGPAGTTLIASATQHFLEARGGIRRRAVSMARSGESKAFLLGAAADLAGYTVGTPQCFRCPPGKTWCSLDTEMEGAEGLCETHTPYRPRPTAERPDVAACDRRFARLHGELEKDYADDVRLASARYDERLDSLLDRTRDLRAEGAALNERIAELRRSEAWEHEPIGTECDRIFREYENKVELWRSTPRGTTERAELSRTIEALDRQFRDCLRKHRAAKDELEELEAKRTKLTNATEALAEVREEKEAELDRLRRAFERRLAELRRKRAVCLRTGRWEDDG